MTIRRTALQRSQRRVSIDDPLALDRRRTMLGYDALGEIEQQFQLPIEGFATDTMGFATAELEFDVDFFDAPEQRDSPLAFPHFTFGAFIDPTDQGESNPTGAVLVTASVSEWVTDTRGAFTGAIVTVGVCLPGGSIDYSGYVHLTFQGYGAPSENVPQLDVGT